MDFDSFIILISVESSLLPTSFEDVNVMEDALIEPAQNTTNANKDDPKSGVMPPVVYPSNLFYLFLACLKVLVVLGFSF